MSVYRTCQGGARPTPDMAPCCSTIGLRRFAKNVASESLGKRKNVIGTNELDHAYASIQSQPRLRAAGRPKRARQKLWYDEILPMRPTLRRAASSPPDSRRREPDLLRLALGGQVTGSMHVRRPPKEIHRQLRDLQPARPRGLRMPTNQRGMCASCTNAAALVRKLIGTFGDLR